MNIRIKSNVAVSDTGFVFDPRTGDSYSMNPIAIEIIYLLKDNKNLDAIVKSINERYEVEEKTIEKDLYDFYQMLVNFHLADILWTSQ